MQPSDLLDNKYRIEQQLGEGGMGAVYRALHLGTKRTVAIKIIHPILSSYDEFVERFRREAEAAGRLRHPNVVDVTDFGFAKTADGPVAYLVMEYLDGCTLAEVLAEEKRLPVQWVVDILEQVCSAVDEAHRVGIIHRDLKPDNIWLEPNRRGGYTVKVLDFGLVKLSEAGPNSVSATSKPLGVTQSAENDSSKTLRFRQQEEKTLLKASPVGAKVAAGESGEQPKETDSNGRLGRDLKIDTDGNLHETRSTGDLTRLGSVMGTPLYMSPEQCRGGPLDARSDIYSLGIIAFQMLAGETPFSGNANSLISQHTTADPAQLREKNSRVPRKLARVVMSALAKDPIQRPQTAAGFGSSLRAATESTGQLLRHAIALYSEHFPSFFKIAVIGYAPLIFILITAFVIDRFVSIESMAAGNQALLGALIFGAMIVANLLAYFIVSAETVPVVVQLIIAPLKVVRLATVRATLKRRWRALVATTVVVVALILGGSILLLIPGVFVAVYFALYSPVVIMEDLSVWQALKRAGRLARRAWASVLTITLLQFALPMLVWRASVDTTFNLELHDDYNPKHIDFSFSSSNESALFQLLNIFVTPLTAIMISLLYLKTRQAGGESLSDVVQRFEALEVPRSKWQTLMRRRSSSETRRS